MANTNVTAHVGWNHCGARHLFTVIFTHCKDASIAIVLWYKDRMKKPVREVSMQDVRAGHRLAAISGRIANCNELAKMITSTCSQKQAMIVDVEYDKYVDYTSVLIIA